MIDRYQQVDLPIYRELIAPVLPDRVLDFHVHIWESAAWKAKPQENDLPGGKYMVVQDQYTTDDLLSHVGMLFPDLRYETVCFGFPSPAFDLDKSNSYVSKAGEREGVYPLLLVKRDMLPKPELESLLYTGGFFGYKVFLNWIGNDYGNVTIEDLIGPVEMELADKGKLAIMLHVPRDGRLCDPDVQRGVRDLALNYPGARIILAHCGRAYLPDEMMQSISVVEDLENVYLDTTMVMDPTVLQIVFEHIDSRRVIYGTDLPIAAMRGRRVYVLDHWVDLVLEGYSPSAYRIASDNMRATFMAYEIILAIRRAAEMSGLSSEQLKAVFYDNGMAILRGVMGGAQYQAAHRRWESADA